MNIKKYSPPSKQDMISWQDQMREAFFEGVTPDDMREVVRKLVEDAKKGDKAATKLLMSYAVDSPSVSVKNAVIVTQGDCGGRTPLPCPPSGTMPGSEGRVEAMERRMTNGQVLFNKRDKACGE